MSEFLGRQDELRILAEFANKKTASFIVIKGRRRIGKSRLVEEFGKQFKKFYSFMGLPPEENVTAAHQLDEFSRQVAQQFNTAEAKYNDWSNALWAVGERVQSGKILLFFDEISWMGSKEPTFLGKIKNFWDQHCKKNDQLVFIICSSASSWIEKNILSSTGFLGRISYSLTLEELSIVDCNQFWPKNISAYEKLKLLSVTGGIPKYLEEVYPELSAEENIKRLCFIKGGFLVEEFNKIFSDLFLRDSALYKKIVECISDGPKQRNEISEDLEMDSGGRISEYLSELELAGFVSRDYTWNPSSGNDSKLSKYRLSDNYTRFYLKYIAKNLSKINRNTYKFKSLMSLSEWSTIMGFQFENMVLKNRILIQKALNINAEDIISDNPFYQNKTTRTLGCQIDYMIQTKACSLYICEIKFYKSKIGSSIISEVQRKIDALKSPMRMSYRPVLIHVNGVHDDVVESNYFSKIIDFSEFLENKN